MRVRFVLVLGAVLFGVAPRHAAGRPACFGGAPQPVAAHQSEPRFLGVAAGYLYWNAGPLRRVGLARSGTPAVEEFPRIGASIISVDGRQGFAVDGGQQLLAYDLPTQASHPIAAGRLSASEAPVLIGRSLQADARYVYYRQDGPQVPLPTPPGTETGLFRVPRDGAGRPELLGSLPAEAWTVDGGFLYFIGREGLVRRPLTPNAQAQVVGAASPSRDQRFFVPRIKIADGRAYFTRGDGIWSAPVDGSSSPVRHVEAGPYGVIDFLVDGACLYWADERRINRAALDSGVPGGPETIADERDFQFTGNVLSGQPRSAGPDVLDTRVLATDGRYLYWADAGGERILRAGRDSRPRRAFRREVSARAGGAAVIDTSPPAGVAWNSACMIHRACAEATPALPGCASAAASVPWTELERGADSLAGKKVNVRGPLALGWIQRGPGFKDIACRQDLCQAQCAPGECCRHDPRPIVIGGGRGDLGLESFECSGDDSRRCCNAPAAGQIVIASGVLLKTRQGGWTLTSPRLCLLPEHK